MARRGLALLAAVGLAVGAGRAAGAQGPDPCARVDGAPAVAGEVAETELVETSGLVASRTHDGVLWAHNDSGDQARLFALGEDGEALGAYAVEGAENVDWEDVAVGPGPDGGSALYVADIGQNGGLRDPVTVYRVPEPEVAPDGTGGTLSGAEALALSYPVSVDAEALLVDPRTGDVLVVTKVVDGTSSILRAAAGSLVPGAPIPMEEVGTVTVDDPGTVDGAAFPGTLVTGGDVAPDGSIVVLRTYKEVLVYARADGATVAEALAGAPCAVPVPNEAQGEAVAVTGSGEAIVTISEVGPAPVAGPLPVHRTALLPPAPADPTTTSEPEAGDADQPGATPTNPERTDDADDGEDRTLLVAALVVVGLVVAAGVATVAVRRRRA